jgi:hypothetical protein
MNFMARGAQGKAHGSRDGRAGTLNTAPRERDQKKTGQA